MASFNRVVMSGSTNILNVNYPYLDKSFVHVYLNNVELASSAYTWLSDSQVAISAGNPAAGTVGETRRITPATPLVSFQPGNLDAGDLNVAALQPIHIGEEARDRLNDLSTRAWLTNNFQTGGTITKAPNGYVAVFDANGNLYGSFDTSSIVAAAGYAQAAAASAVSASGFATAASGSATLSAAWSSTAEDVQVPGAPNGSRSALHWMRKAEDQVGLAAAQVALAAGQVTLATNQVTAATAQATLAGAWANTAEDTNVPGAAAGSRSAFHWMKKAEDQAILAAGYLASAVQTAINGAAAKATLVDADLFGVLDSAASFVIKKTTLAQLVASIFTAARKIANVNVLSTTFRIWDTTAPTKGAAFSLTEITAGQTRTITIPDANVDLGDIPPAPFVSSNQTIGAAGTSVSVAHGFGAVPNSFQVDAVCLTAELGWAVGEICPNIGAGIVVNGAGHHGIGWQVTTTNIILFFVNPAAISIPNKSSPTLFNWITPANWRLIVRARK